MPAALIASVTRTMSPWHVAYQGRDGRMDVYAVVDHFAGDARNKRRPDDARLAVAQRAHAVEQMGGHGRPGVDSGARLGVGGVRVPDGGHRARVHDVADEINGTGQLRRDGHAAQCPPCRLDNSGEGPAVGHQEVRRVVGTAARIGQERALEVRPMTWPNWPGPASTSLGHPAQLSISELGAAVARETSVRVVPWRRWNATAAAMSSGDAVMS